MFMNKSEQLKKNSYLKH